LTARIEAPAAESTRFANWAFCLVVAVGIAAAVRLQPVISAPFVLNDGGLFAQMAGDLTANGFLLPSFTTYNGLELPFAYPPLGLIVLAVTSGLLGVHAEDVVRWLPVVISIASVGAMYLVSAELLRSRWRGIAAAAVFGLMPRSYMWLIVGGGVTRAPGMLLALLAIYEGLRLLRTRWRMHLVLTALLAGLTFLSHPQAAIFVGISLTVVFAFHADRRTALRTAVDLILIAGGAFLVASPWIATVIAAHGVQPLVSAAQSGSDIGAGLSVLLSLAFTDIGVVDVLTVLGILGVFLRIARGQLLVPTWLVLTVLLDPRAGTTYVTVPLALSAVPILGELLDRVRTGTRHTAEIETVPIPRLVQTHRGAVVFLCLLLFMSLRTTSRAAVDHASPLFSLSPGQLQAMAWVNESTPHDAQFLVVTGLAYQWDFVSEWFPVKAQRRSPGTVQGSEWGGLQFFLKRLAASRQLQECSIQTASCIAHWQQGWNVKANYVFLPKGRLGGPLSTADCCLALREGLMASPDYLVVYDGDGATVFQARVPTG
jgi:hypothetical protein